MLGLRFARSWSNKRRRPNYCLDYVRNGKTSLKQNHERIYDLGSVIFCSEPRFVIVFAIDQGFQVMTYYSNLKAAVDI